MTCSIPARLCADAFHTCARLAFAQYSVPWSAYTPHTEGVAASEHAGCGRAAVQAETLTYHAVPSAGDSLDPGTPYAVSYYACSVADKANHAVTPHHARTKNPSAIVSCTEGDTEHTVATLTSANYAGALNAFAPYARVSQAMADNPSGADDRYVAQVSGGNPSRSEHAHSHG